MVAIPAVTITVNGALASGAQPVALVDGHVVGEVGASVERFASWVTFSPANGTIIIVRDRHRVIVRGGRANLVVDGHPQRVTPSPVMEGTELIAPLAPIVRGLGGTAHYDTRTRTFAIAFLAPPALSPAPPFDPLAPTVAPTVLFTPELHPTPRVTLSGPWTLRRTPIPIVAPR